MEHLVDSLPASNLLSSLAEVALAVAQTTVTETISVASTTTTSLLLLAVEMVYTKRLSLLSAVG